MLPAARARIESIVSDAQLVLDVGGWAEPFPRADWVIDLMPYETRGLYGRLEPEAERFRSESWVCRDICDHDPWPFDDHKFDFAVCSQTHEDIRDPVWACHELNRVAKAGYIEVPSRLEEQRLGVHGPWVGWSHHRWLVDVFPSGVEFVFKPHMLAGCADFRFPAEIGAELSAEEGVQSLFWTGGFEYRERIFHQPEELDAYLANFVSQQLPRMRLPRSSLRERFTHRLRRRR